MGVFFVFVVVVFVVCFGCTIDLYTCGYLCVSCFQVV